MLLNYLRLCVCIDLFLNRCKEKILDTQKPFVYDSKGDCDE